MQRFNPSQSPFTTVQFYRPRLTAEILILYENISEFTNIFGCQAGWRLWGERDSDNKPHTLYWHQTGPLQVWDCDVAEAAQHVGNIQPDNTAGSTLIWRTIHSTIFSAKILTISFSADAEEADEELPEKRIENNGVEAAEDEKGGKQQDFQEIELRFLTPEEKIKRLEVAEMSGKVGRSEVFNKIIGYFICCSNTQ